jgi:hypothetical protein
VAELWKREMYTSLAHEQNLVLPRELFEELVPEMNPWFSSDSPDHHIKWYRNYEIV